MGPAEWGACVRPAGRELASSPLPAPPTEPRAELDTAAGAAQRASAAMAGAPTLALLLLGQLLAVTMTEAQVSMGLQACWARTGKQRPRVGDPGL